MAALPAWRDPRGVAVARAVSAMAEPAFAGPLIAVAAAVAARRNGLRAAAVPALAVPAGVVARWLLSEAIARPRPPAALWLAEPEGFSLPSRHTTLAALTAGALTAAAGGKGLRWHAIPLLAGAGVGASRVYLGVHWPSDVLAGSLFAVAWLGLAEMVGPDPVPRPSDPRRPTPRPR
jgi:membrane-associated phospholipid phosphatase